jgi:hypothetical protein
MSFQLHERGIHALCFGTGGVRVTEVRLGVRRTAVAAGLTGNSWSWWLPLRAGRGFW